MADLFKNKLAVFFQALGNPLRMEILDLLKQKKEMCVCEMVALLKREQSVVSRHLIALRQAGILDCETKATRSFYRIKDERIYKIIEIASHILGKKIREEQKAFALI